MHSFFSPIQSCGKIFEFFGQSRRLRTDLSSTLSWLCEAAGSRPFLQTPHDNLVYATSKLEQKSAHSCGISSVFANAEVDRRTGVAMMMFERSDVLAELPYLDELQNAFDMMVQLMPQKRVVLEYHMFFSLQNHPIRGCVVSVISSDSVETRRAFFLFLIPSSFYSLSRNLSPGAKRRRGDVLHCPTSLFVQRFTLFERSRSVLIVGHSCWTPDFTHMHSSKSCAKRKQWIQKWWRRSQVRYPHSGSVEVHLGRT